MSDNLDETVLNVQQRMKRGLIMRRNKPKMERMKELSKKRPASNDKIKKRAYAQARQIVRTRYAGKYGANYENLSTSEKIAIDRAIDKKQALIKKLALRLIPKVKRADQQRLSSFLHGEPLKSPDSNIGKPVQESAETILLNALFLEEFKSKDNKKDDSKKEKIGQSPNVEILNRFDNKVSSALNKKSEKTGICVETLGKVYIRGLKSWNEQMNISPEQHAFTRVNSFINKGKSYFEEDYDLLDEEKKPFKISITFSTQNGELISKKVTVNANTKSEAHILAKNYIMKKYNAKIHNSKKTNSINEEVNRKIHFGVSMWKGPDYKNKELKHVTFSINHPYKSGIAQPDGAGGHYLHQGWYADKLSNHPEIKRLKKQGWQEAEGSFKSSLDKNDVTKHLASYVEDNSNTIRKLHESKNTPYVKPHYGDESKPKIQTAWKASNKHGNVKYFGIDFKASANKHAGLNEEILDEGKMKQLAADIETMDNGNFKKKYNTDKQTLSTALNKPSTIKIGDNVHLGFSSKGGAGFRGKVVNLDDTHVHVKSKYSDKIYKGPKAFVTPEDRNDVKHVSRGIEANHPMSTASTLARHGEIKQKIIDEVRQPHPALKNAQNNLIKINKGEHKIKTPVPPKEKTEKLPKRIDPYSKTVTKALENELGGKFEHHEMRPRHVIKTLPDGRKMAGVKIITTHTYDLKKDLGFDDNTIKNMYGGSTHAIESHHSTVYKHPDHGLQIHITHHNIPWGENSEIKDQIIESRKITDFSPKLIKGLYHYNHYEHPDGSWFQSHVSNKTRKTKEFIVKAKGDSKLTKYDNAKDVKKHLGISEEVKNADKIPVVIPAHKDQYGNDIQTKTVMRKQNKKIIKSGDVHDGDSNG